MNSLQRLITCPTWTIAVTGAQWGDEGKGKIVDFLSGYAEILVRAGGGANAGHTLVVDGTKHVIHLLPSGIIRPGTMNLLGPGVVCDLAVLASELTLATRYGAQVMLDPSALVVHPLHKILDNVREKQAGDNAIGTTKRGIGPAYEDLASRRGLRLGDLTSRKSIIDAFQQGGYWQEKQSLLRTLTPEGIPSLTEIVDWAAGFSDQITPHLGDTRAKIAHALASNKRILCEGAQGIMLDLIHGQPPYTTSTGSTAAAIMATTGINRFDAVIGVTKGYATRVGAGPFPTNLSDRSGQELRERGHEFGTTTGRARSCGWLDLPALRYACRIGGITHLIVTKLDILANFPGGIKVCVDYGPNALIDEYTTLTTRLLTTAQPVYQEFDAWNEKDLIAHKLGTGIQTFIKLIERITEHPVSAFTHGAERRALRFLGR